jgi:hypothetical protein
LHAYELLAMAGFRLRSDGDRLFVSPPPTEHEALFIREHKDELVLACRDVEECRRAIAAWNLMVQEDGRKRKRVE